MLEITARGNLRRNGWAAGKVGAPITELLPSEEELIDLWEELRARARAVEDDLFQVSGAVQAPDPPLVSAQVRFVAPPGAVDTLKALSFNLIGLEKELRKLHQDTHLDQLLENGKPGPEWNILIRVSSQEQLPQATEAMETLAEVIRNTRVGEFVADPLA